MNLLMNKGGKTFLTCISYSNNVVQFDLGDYLVLGELAQYKGEITPY